LQRYEHRLSDAGAMFLIGCFEVSRK